MRGKDTDEAFYQTDDRITPAYAGKSHLYGIITVEVRDHPRLCGEKSHFVKCSRSFTGSPPPMRGKGIAEYFDVDVSGITPAYAGKRALGFEYIEKKQDHPRLCGEKSVCVPK